jgi:hypothetical protein
VKQCIGTEKCTQIVVYHRNMVCRVYHRLWDMGSFQSHGHNVGHPWRVAHEETLLVAVEDDRKISTN